MFHYGRALGSVAMLAFGLGCHVQQFTETDHREYRFEQNDAPAKISVRTDDGSIEIIGKEGGDIDIDVEIRARASSPAMAESVLETIDIEATENDGEIRIVATKKHSDGFDFTSVRADISIRVPTGGIDNEFRLYTKDGNVELERLQGTVNVETEDGNIEMHRVSGNIILRSGDGRIRGESLVGSVEADTDDGSIRLGGTFSVVSAYTDDGSVQVDCERAVPLEKDWSIRSDDGSIRLRLPEGLSAELDASTDDGRIVNELSGFEDQRKDDDHFRGSIGGGGKLILLKAYDGRITLSQS